jgi:hypothetical protein
MLKAASVTVAPSRSLATSRTGTAAPGRSADRVQALYGLDRPWPCLQVNIHIEAVEPIRQTKHPAANERILSGVCSEVRSRKAAPSALELTLEFAARVASLFVAVDPFLPAEHLGVPFTLRITDGQIAPDASGGPLETAGSPEIHPAGWRPALHLPAGPRTRARDDAQRIPVHPHSGRAGPDPAPCSG